MVATAENTQMTQWRSVHADWAAANPIPASGEFVWAEDIKVLKIGDGVTAYNSLPKLFDGTLEYSELTSAVDAATKAVQDAQDAATSAGQSNADTIGLAANALTAANAALANQQLARDYAVGPPGTVLPTGGDSAAVSAAKASDIALETRHIRMPPADVSADKTLASGDLFREHDCTNTGLITITVPSGLFTSTDRKKAWAIFRQRGTGGSIKVQAASGGSDLVAPQVVKSGVGGYRALTVPTDGAAKNFTCGGIPAVTAGRLVVIGVALWNVSGGNTLTCSSDSGLTWTTRRAQTDPATTLVPSWSVFDAPLTSYAGGDVVVTLDPSTQAQYLGLFWFVLEGTVSGGPSIVVVNSSTVASNVSATLTALAATSQVLAVSAQRGGSTTTAHTSFSTNITRIGSSNTAGANDTAVSDNNNTKNMVFGRGTGVPATTADFTVRSDFSVAFDEPSIILVAYGPKTVVGGGTVTLQLEGGRDTMTVQHGEMMLKFMPDGTTVQVLTSH